MRNPSRDWIPIDERLPEIKKYPKDEVLLSFENEGVLPAIGRYYRFKDGSGAFYLDDDEPCSKAGLFVNAWMPLPEPYREEENEDE